MRKIGFNLGLGALGYLVVSLCSADEAQPLDTVFFSAPEFQITESELRWYLGKTMNPDGEVDWGSIDQVKQGLRDLYALKVMSMEARELSLVSPEEQEWIEYYEVAITGVRRYIQQRAAQIFEAIDWDSEAMEQYIAERDAFTVPETLTARHLLLEVGRQRTLEEALSLAAELAPATLDLDAFEAVVRAHTEEPGGRDSGGLLPEFTSGDMVPEFEAAAFALQREGEISAPVVTDYGVHVIQLISRNPSHVQPFETVKAELVEQLKIKRWEESIAAIKASAQMVEPEGLVVHQQAIDAFLLSVDDR